MRPPDDGCYSVRRPSGEAFVVQWSNGRLVELLGPVTLKAPPKRTTTRYLGRSWADVQREQAERRRIEMLKAYGMGVR
jgi:hypothetical protein